jgi:hypothetical protein
MNAREHKYPSHAMKCEMRGQAVTTSNNRDIPECDPWAYVRVPPLGLAYPLSLRERFSQ